MKMILLLYLEGDRELVHELLRRHEVAVFSDLAMEGHGRGPRADARAGWYGDVPPFDSRMTFTLVPEERAADLMDAVQECSGCQHPQHPVHAVQLGVERAVDSGVPRPAANA